MESMENPILAMASFPFCPLNQGLTPEQLRAKQLGEMFEPLMWAMCTFTFVVFIHLVYTIIEENYPEKIPQIQKFCQKLSWCIIGYYLIHHKKYIVSKKFWIKSIENFSTEFWFSKRSRKKSLEVWFTHLDTHVNGRINTLCFRVTCCFTKWRSWALFFAWKRCARPPIWCIHDTWIFSSNKVCQIFRIDQHTVRYLSNFESNAN